MPGPVWVVCVGVVRNRVGASHTEVAVVCVRDTDTASAALALNTVAEAAQAIHYHALERPPSNQSIVTVPLTGVDIAGLWNAVLRACRITERVQHARDVTPALVARVLAAIGEQPPPSSATGDAVMDEIANDMARELGNARTRERAAELLRTRAVLPADAPLPAGAEGVAQAYARVRLALDACALSYVS